MMLERDTIAELATATAEECAAVAMALAARMLTLSATTNGNGHAPEAETWITPEQAATIASVPVKRVYDWARGKRWTSRPTRRCLRIDEAGFRRWLVVKAP
jgi:hypothetical protein